MPSLHTFAMLLLLKHRTLTTSLHPVLSFAADFIFIHLHLLYTFLSSV